MDSGVYCPRKRAKYQGILLNVLINLAAGGPAFGRSDDRGGLRFAVFAKGGSALRFRRRGVLFSRHIDIMSRQLTP